MFEAKEVGTVKKLKYAAEYRITVLPPYNSCKENAITAVAIALNADKLNIKYIVRLPDGQWAVRVD